MKENRFTPIFILGAWKSGTTVLQYLLSRDENIQNLFPNDRYNHFEGRGFWRKHLGNADEVMGEYAPSWIVETRDYSDMVAELESMWDGVSSYVVLKRPQLLLKLSALKKAWPHAKFIGIGRDLLPNVYSLRKMQIKMDREFEYSDKEVIDDYETLGVDVPEFVGMMCPFWKSFMSSEHAIHLQSFIWQYYYVNNTLAVNDIFTVRYEDVVDATANTIKRISSYLDYDIDINIPELCNYNDEYLYGGYLTSRNEKTQAGGIEADIEDRPKDFPPFTNDEVAYIEEMARYYRHTDVLRFM